MKASDFTSDMPGELVRTLDGSNAFLPARLPPELTWTNELIASLSRADHAIGRLAGVATADLGAINPHLLIRPFMQREAVLSSQIEGTQASLSDLFLFEQISDTEEHVPDVREVSNYVKALEHGLASLHNRKLGASLIRELHHVLMTGVRGGDKTPGALRNLQVFIGSSSRIEESRFVPPPPIHVPGALEALEDYLQRPNDYPTLIRVALVHYQFESIHPFQDGNGRVGMLLITLMLCASGLLPQPMLYLSAYFERNRVEYYQRLLDVSQKGAWLPWVEFFLKGVQTEADDAVQRVTHLLRMRLGYHAKLHAARSSALTLKLIDALFTNPAITAGRAATLLGVSATSAQNHIDRLVQAGILVETTGRKRNRVYLAEQIVKTLDEPNGKEP